MSDNNQHPMHQEIEVAAEWWTDVIRGGAKQDNGDHLSAAIMEVFAEKNQQVIPEEDLLGFKRELIKRLTDKKDSNIIKLFTDYYPNQILQEAADAGGLKVTTLTFPCKTYMKIKKGEVQVEYGYRADFETIYPKP